LNEEDCLNGARNGNHDAYRQIINRHKQKVAHTIFGMLGNCSEAEDVGQETFIMFFRSLKSFRADSSIGTYLTRIAINLCLNELNRRKRNRKLFQRISDAEFSAIPNSKKGINEKENEQLVYQALDHLAPKFRSVIVLRLMDGYSTRETAQILGIPSGTVLARLKRAQQKLKHFIILKTGENR
jgi:RNA polymerase sigma-70 factor (ECF subfamily)